MIIIMDDEAEIQTMLRAGKVSEVIELIRRETPVADPKRAEHLFYLLGNAHRKRGDWQQALNAYSEAVALNPDSPAASARHMVMDILNFYHKDFYNP